MAYLSMPYHPSLRRVLGQEVQPQAGEDLVRVLVLPQELDLPDGDEVRVGPDLDEEELAQGQDLGLAVLLVLDGLVERVGGMMAARIAHKL